MQDIKGNDPTSEVLKGIQQGFQSHVFKPTDFAECWMKAKDIMSPYLPKRALGFCKMKESPKEIPPFYLFGQTGTGKTVKMVGALLVNMALEAMKDNQYFFTQQHKRTRFVSCLNFKQNCLNFNGKNEYLNKLARAKSLYIDDLGAEIRNTDSKICQIVSESMAFVINERYNSNRNTFFTSNLEIFIDAKGIGSIDSLYGRRIAERIDEMCFKSVFKMDKKKRPLNEVKEEK